MCAFFVNFFNKKIKIKKTPVFGGERGFGRILICLIQTVVCFGILSHIFYPRNRGIVNLKLRLIQRTVFPKRCKEQGRGFQMKRAFIRLFGCILSAIGLSMSYDTTFTVLLGDESAPGAAWAASGTGSGCDYSLGTCYPAIPNSFVVTGLTGSCSFNGERVSYFVVLAPWYVGWLNVDYTGAGGVPYDNWPVGDFSASERVAMNLMFSGSSRTYVMDGTFGASSYGTGSLSASSVSPAQRIDWCYNNGNGISLGLPTNLGHISEAAVNSMRNSCVLNTEEAGNSNRTYDLYVWSAVYMPTSDAFQNMGCCLYASSTGTSGSSGTGTSAGDGCKCYYAQATQEYPYTAYGRTEVGTTNHKISTSTVPFYEPFVFYHYNGCKAGYTPTGTVTGTDANFAIALLSPHTDFIVLVEEGSHCPDLYSDIDAGTYGIFREQSAEYPNFIYNWKNCDMCSTYTDIANKSTYSPTITNVGTATEETSETVNRCYVDVNGVKDASGTFNFTSTCYYDQ